MWQWMMELEATKYDLAEKFKRQKYDVSPMKHKPSKNLPKNKDIWWVKGEKEASWTREKCNFYIFYFFYFLN